jgi:bacterioferritin (cytochrome b1)
MKSIEGLIKNQEIVMHSQSEEVLSQDTQISDLSLTEKAQEVDSYSNEEVIVLLKSSLNIHWQQTIELTAQAIHLERWGYKKLADLLKDDAKEEHLHSAVNIQRLEFFDVDYQPLVISPKSWKRHDIKALIEFNLESVRNAANVEKAVIRAARDAGDEITASMMIPLLQGSENGIELYESYLKVIEQIGIDNFLTLQV